VPAKFHSALPFPLIALLALFATALSCGSSGDPFANKDDQGLAVQVMNPLDLGVGQTRMPFFVFLPDMTRLDDRLADMTFRYRGPDETAFTAVTGVTWRKWPVSGGAYVMNFDYDRPGIWEFQVTLRDATRERTGSTFTQVKASSSAPDIGDPAPSVSTKTASTVDEVRQISSAFSPDPGFYSVSLDDALKNGKPTVVLFSTPAYCNSGTCGPQLEALAQLKEGHADEVNFIHVEIWDNIREMQDTGNRGIGRVSPAVEAWGLISEPWTFFIGADGVIVDRYEQFATVEELQAALQRLLG
jgi:hypothetical protein